MTIPCLRDVIDVREQIRRRDHEVQMNGVFRAEFQWMGTTFVATPEPFTFGRHMITREIEQQLSDGVVKLLLE